MRKTTIALLKIFHLAFFFLLCVFLQQKTYAQEDGKSLFIQKCASCHGIDKDLAGPALKGIEERVPDQKLLYDWIRNSPKVLASGNVYFTKLYEDWNKTQMNLFEDLSDEQIASILTYVKEWEPKVKVASADNTGERESSGYNDLLIGIIVIFLAILMFVLMYVNTSLKNIIDKKQGFEVLKKIPLIKRKSFWAILAIIFTVWATYMIVDGAINLGINTKYKPDQPIYFSHKVHAGLNQINCLYCHTSAEQGKHANIPSLNVCMNCHMAINEYNGEPLIAENGETIDGTEEIQKIYFYAGWDTKAKKYTSEPKPIEWVRIHNLPDHVYFNHSQHVSVGKVQCQTCHGPIHEMNKVYQYSSLSMGWCVNCHRETQVQFTQNKFYNLYEKYHNDLKNGDLESVTVERIGGLECQKCHY